MNGIIYSTGQLSYLCHTKQSHLFLSFVLSATNNCISHYRHLYVYINREFDKLSLSSPFLGYERVVIIVIMSYLLIVRNTNLRKVDVILNMFVVLNDASISFFRIKVNSCSVLFSSNFFFIKLIDKIKHSA